MTEQRRTERVDFTQRDSAVLTWIGEMYGARIDVVTVLLGRHSPLYRGRLLSTSSARKQIDRWERAGWATAESVFGETWVTLTPKGYARVGQNYATWRMPSSKLRHTHTVNVLRLWWESQPQASDYPWQCERALFVERGRNDHWHIPDAQMVRPGADLNGPADWVGLEVELTHKSKAAYWELIGNLRGGVKLLQYFVSDEAFGRRLQATLSEVITQRRSGVVFNVQILPEVEGASYSGRGW